MAVSSQLNLTLVLFHTGQVDLFQQKITGRTDEMNDDPVSLKCVTVSQEAAIINVINIIRSTCACYVNMSAVSRHIGNLYPTH